ncbi:MULTISPECIES: Maf family protein [unclassified Candidatus Sulfotelmatobacter]|uniref:Maf family protein n=1 Tax=unclassified Candidatus Sulfotelmatobacter TaxID=2635724 RepID=UPI001689DE5F|nr:Maf family protein [Kocuria sp. cx-116]MBD2762700.1 septum formation inhibitor Maf [Kocuria sp. cx-116]
MRPVLILASQSPARAALLTRAHLPYDTVVSRVDEDAALAEHGPLSPSDTALLLARAKADAVASLEVAEDRVVLGCDSVFELNGESYGKPYTADLAVERITAMSGQKGTLHTGHWLVDRRNGETHGEGEVSSADVYFSHLSREDIDDYVATGEPLQVAGSFTLDGRGSMFIDRVSGDPNAVIGLSISTLRRLLAARGITASQWWRPTPQVTTS